jgi:hypothetical protein
VPRSGTLLWALLVLGLQGCSVGGSGSSGPVPLTPAQFRSRAAAICASTTGELAALKTPTDVAGLVRQGRRAIVLEQRERAALRALPPPSGLAGQVRAMLDAVERAIADSRSLIAAVQEGDKERLQSATAALRRHLTTANDLARRLRLGRCVIAA